MSTINTKEELRQRLRQKITPKSNARTTRTSTTLPAAANGNVEIGAVSELISGLTQGKKTKKELKKYLKGFEAVLKNISPDTAKMLPGLLDSLVPHGAASDSIKNILKQHLAVPVNTDAVVDDTHITAISANGRKKRRRRENKAKKQATTIERPRFTTSILQEPS